MIKTLDIKPTFNCPFNCPTCIERRTLYKQFEKDKLLTIDDWLLCFKYAIPYFQELTISGAEPLMYKHLTTLIQYNGFLNININTNALLLTKEMTHTIVNSNTSNICISLTTLDKQTYLTARGIANLNSYDIVLKNIKYFNKHKQQIYSRCSMFLTKYNIFEIPKMILTFRFLGFDSFVIHLLEGNYGNNEYRITEDQVIEFEKNYIHRIPHMYREDIKKMLYKSTHPLEYRTYEQCTIPNNFAMVLANGIVYPCNVHEYSHEGEIGNLFDVNMDIIQIMNNKKIQHFNNHRSIFCNRCPMYIRTIIKY